jgi:hypothetical protein
MKIIGLLSTEEEVNDIKYIAKIVTLEDRIHFICRIQKLKDLLKREK